MIKKLVIIYLFLTLMFSGNLLAQYFPYVFWHINKNYNSLYYRTSSTYIAPLPFAFVSKKFSPDSGTTWIHAGTFGQNLRPYIQKNPRALKNLNIYSAIRTAGIAQIFVIAPVFLIKEIQYEKDYQAAGPPYEPNDSKYVPYIFAFIYSGSITYHLIAKPFLKNAIREYHSIEKLSIIDIKYKPHLLLTYNEISNSPMVTLRWKL